MHHSNHQDAIQRLMHPNLTFINYSWRGLFTTLQTLGSVFVALELDSQLPTAIAASPADDCKDVNR